jgi:hypothetical protein
LLPLVGPARDLDSDGEREEDPTVSDIGINLPVWFMAGYLVVMGWYVSVPAMIVLTLVGFSSDLARGWRLAAFGATTLLAAPFIVYGVGTAIDAIKYRKFQAEVHRTLDRAESVTGLTLPAGSDIYFTDKSQTQILSVRLPVVTAIRGVRVTGTLTWQDVGNVWESELASDQVIGGFPCAAGFITFDNDGTVYECRLAAAHGLLGFMLPKGTKVTRGDNKKPWNLLLPDDAGLAIPALAATAPPGAMLHVSGDGRLESTSSGDGATMIVHGVPLNSMNLFVRSDHVVASLKEPFLVAGEMQPADTGVRIDLATGDVSLAGKNWWLAN